MVYARWGTGVIEVGLAPIKVLKFFSFFLRNSLLLEVLKMVVL